MPPIVCPIMNSRCIHESWHSQGSLSYSWSRIGNNYSTISRQSIRASARFGSHRIKSNSCDSPNVYETYSTLKNYRYWPLIWINTLQLITKQSNRVVSAAMYRNFHNGCRSQKLNFRHFAKDLRLSAIKFNATGLQSTAVSDSRNDSESFLEYNPYQIDTRNELKKGESQKIGWWPVKPFPTLLFSIRSGDAAHRPGAT